jgi:hypothetical protein
MLSKKGSTEAANTDSCLSRSAGDSQMMGREDRGQGQLFYEFKLDDVVPKNHPLRRLNVFVTTALADLHEQLKPFYSEIGVLVQRKGEI